MMTGAWQESTLDTGNWIRPVTGLDDGRVRLADMKLGGYSPVLLDVLEIPLDSNGPDFGFESENRTILPGQWNHRGKLTPEEIQKYIKRPYYVLHNSMKYVNPKELQRKHFEKRETLQLIQVDKFSIRNAREKAADKNNWKGLITSGKREIDVKITDPVFSNKLNKGHKTSSSCILTMSLSMPHKPSGWSEGEEPVCWKLIAGVIELPKQ